MRGDTRTERLALVVTPVVAIATLMLGLRVGATRAMRAAVVYGAPPAAGRSGLAWQIVTLVDDRGVREALALQGIRVVARAHGREASWHGPTNDDGVAEAWLDLADVHRGDPLEIEVRADDEPSPLAQGSVAWDSEPWGPGTLGGSDGGASGGATGGWVRPSKREGEVAIDVAIVGERLAPGFAGSVWVHLTDRATGAPLTNAAVDSDPEPGLTVTPSRASICRPGWASLSATPALHVVGLSLHAETPEGKRGDWFGALSVAPGAMFVDAPARVAAGVATQWDVVVPTVRPLAYVEIDDTSGRAFAAALAVSPSADGIPHAAFDVPPLAPGLYWLVTAGDPRGAETLEGAAVARPFFAGDGGAAAPQGVRIVDGTPSDPCALGPELAQRRGGGFRRWTALDGLPGKRARDGANRARGLFIAFGSLAIAAVLETLLILGAVARSRRELARIERALDDVSSPLAERASAMSVVIGVLLALLGFGLLAVLLTWRAS